MRRSKSLALVSFKRTSLDPLPRLWILRMLVALGGQRSFVGNHGFNDDAIAEAVGLGEWLDCGTREYDQTEARAALRRSHADAEATLRAATVPPLLTRNTVRLADLVGLDETDCRVSSSPC